MTYNLFPNDETQGIKFVQIAQTTGLPNAFYLESALNTGGTASTEWKNVYWNFSTAKQWATGDLSFNRDFFISATGYVFDGASTVTVGATLAIGGGPAARTNATITNSVSCLLDNWQPNATSGYNLAAGIPGIEDGQGNVVNRYAIYVSDLFGNSFGDQTANVTNICGIAVPIVNLTASANTRTVTGNVASIYVAGAINLGAHMSFAGTSYALFVDAGPSRFDGRILGGKGANIAAANDLTLGTDGSVFTITGNTTINGIATAGWTSGSVARLIFTGTPTVKHNTAASAGFASLLLSASIDLGATNNTVLSFLYDGTYWQECERKAP